MSYKEFFQEQNGRFSMQRLTTFLLVISAVVISFLAVKALFTGLLITELTYLIGVLLSGALGSKVWSKYFEEKKENGK